MIGESAENLVGNDGDSVTRRTMICGWLALSLREGPRHLLKILGEGHPGQYVLPKRGMLRSARLNSGIHLRCEAWQMYSTSFAVDDAAAALLRALKTVRN